MNEEKIGVDAVMELFNKRAGLLEIGSGTLDARELAKRDDEASKLALAMFSYRVRPAVGAYMRSLRNSIQEPADFR